MAPRRAPALLAAAAAALPARCRAWSCGKFASPTNATLARVWLRDTDAVCNDGSPAAYYFRQATNPSQAHVWLVYLGGGGQCYDADSCAARWNGTGYPHHDCRSSSAASPCFMSSKDYPEQCPKTGVFDTDPDKSPIAGANKVYLPYCSSDAHTGNAAKSAATGGFHMRGARIVASMLRDLSARRGLGARGGDVLVFGGGSAGGRGAMAWLDFVAPNLPSAANVDIVGYLDSPYYIDVAPMSSFGGFQAQTVAVLANFNASGVVPADCAAAYPDAPWRCLYGQWRMPFVRTRYLLVAAQYDTWQLSHDVHGYDGMEPAPAYTAAERAYVDRFGAQTQALVGTLPSAAAAGGASVYSAACYNHHIAEKPGFWELATSDGTPQRDALAVMLAPGKEPRAPVPRWVDTCVGYNCGGGCSAV